MSWEDIRALYRKLSSDFVTKPFNEVLNRCQDHLRKYYSCYPLQLQIGILLFNHSMLSGDKDKTTELTEEILEVFVRVKNESEDVELAKQALSMEIICLLTLGRPNEVLELIDEANLPMTTLEPLLATAYQMAGREAEAKRVLQIGVYQHLLALLNLMVSYLPLCTDEGERFEEGCRRFLTITDAFHLEALQPAILMNFYLAAAQGYLALGSQASALDSLQSYGDLVTGDIYPLDIKGDDFFDLLDSWLDGLTLGTAPPRDERTIRQSMLEALDHPAFATLAENRRFAEIRNKLKENLKGV